MKIEIKIPTLGESINEATVSEIIKESNQFVQMDDEIIELETDKVNQVLNAPDSGILELNIKVNDNVKVGQVIGYVDTEGKKNITKKEKSSLEEGQKVVEPTKLDQKDTIRETEDEYLASLDKTEEEEKSEEKSAKTIDTSKKETRSKMSKLRKVISKRLVDVKNQTAMLTTFNEVNMDKIIEFRTKEQASFLKKHSIKLGFMSFFIKAVILALKKYPEINAYIDQDEIVYRNYFNIGIAVGTDKGLFVPVLRDCDKMSFVEIEKKLSELAEKARNEKIALDDLKGAGFTITNGGVYGSLLSTPILNPPQSGILGMHSIQKRPIAINDQIVIKPMMYLALSYDHRIVDGKEAIGFLVEIKNHLEDPTRILVDL
jgi:2-oxoglutarate dehydrogenase E2 component (dihydrolipoamide succinyltransferase)